MAKRYFEDFAAGMVLEHGPRLVTREEIVAFAAEFDPQPMHLDEEAARHSILGGLAASGWHICCLMMRMACDSFVLDSSSMGAPGVDEVKWLKPLRPGTQITLRTTVLDTRTSKSRPEMGFVKTHIEVLDDDHGQIMTLTTSMIMERRASAAAAAS
jgi:acyl dehydratase